MRKAILGRRYPAVVGMGALVFIVAGYVGNAGVAPDPPVPLEPEAVPGAEADCPDRPAPNPFVDYRVADA